MYMFSKLKLGTHRENKKSDMDKARDDIIWLISYAIVIRIDTIKWKPRILLNERKAWNVHDIKKNCLTSVVRKV